VAMNDEGADLNLENSITLLRGGGGGAGNTIIGAHEAYSNIFSSQELVRKHCC